MKKWPIVIAIIVFSAPFAAPMFSFAAESALFAKLPYAAGQSFVVTQGYDTPPTHIKKDSYALDLTQDGCAAYGKAVVAAASGKAMFVGQEGYNGGYGTELIIDHGDTMVSRYAHMIPDSITVTASDTMIRQGQTVGLVGDTGLVSGFACADHPGTHLHFAMDTVNGDGTFSAYDPEPISGYIGMTAGGWYLSDNDEKDDNSAGVALPGKALGTYDEAVTTTTDVMSSTLAAISTTMIIVPTPTVTLAPPVAPVPPSVAPPQTNTPVPIGGVSIMSNAVTMDSPSTEVATSISTSTASTTEATSTVYSSSSTVMSTAPAATGTLFAQRGDNVNSPASWYDDNWFALGNGFAGTLTAITLEGAVSDEHYSASQVSLQEFKDKNYTALVQEFPISGNAPFTPTMATATFGGFSILLKPYFYYRLATDQPYQNRSVILAGTATTTTGTVMWNNFIYGTGRVEYTAPFFPFVLMEGVIATPPLTPPPLTPPTDLAEHFDELGMQLGLSWGTSTDPDWPANPLHYEMNYSTSTSLPDAGWIEPGSIPVNVGNTYLVGIRAKDNYGDISAAATATWNFPEGFSPYLLSPGLNHASQYFTVPSTSTLRSITLFTTNMQTSVRNPDVVGCSLQLFDEHDLSSLGMTQADNGFNGYGCGGTLAFSFASSSPVLHPDHRYHWVFAAQTGNPSTGASVQFYGTATDTATGSFNDPSLASAKFTVTGDSGVLFLN